MKIYKPRRGHGRKKREISTHKQETRTKHNIKNAQESDRMNTINVVNNNRVHTSMTASIMEKTTQDINNGGRISSALH